MAFHGFLTLTWPIGMGLRDCHQRRQLLVFWKSWGLYPGGWKRSGSPSSRSPEGGTSMAKNVPQKSGLALYPLAICSSLRTGKWPWKSLIYPAITWWFSMVFCMVTRRYVDDPGGVAPWWATNWREFVQGACWAGTSLPECSKQPGKVLASPLLGSASSRTWSPLCTGVKLHL